MTTRLTRAEAIAESLREAILNGQHLSGERLIEVKIAQSFEVSQNTVRDALRILEGEGWVNKNPRHGVYVRSFTTADAAEVCDLIGALETLALTWLIPHLDKVTRADLHALLETARRLSYADDRLQAFDCLMRFHQRIGLAARKRLTAQFLETLYNQVRLIEATREARMPRTGRELAANIAICEEMLSAIDAGDVDAASANLREQVRAYNASLVGIFPPSTPST
jgi:DNA-binding GntR family transcriptional regulator